MTIVNIRGKNGFSILGVILVIVAVIVAIGVWALSGQSNTTGTNNSARIQVSSLSNDSSSIKLAYDTLVINGTSPATITYVPNTAGGSNMLDPTNGITAPQVTASALFPNAVEPDGIWVYSHNKFTVNNSGVNNPHDVIVVSGIKDTVCQELNSSLNGTNTIPSYSGFTNSNQFTAGATKDNPNTTTVIDFQSHGLNGGVTSDWTVGCISAGGTANQNIFFRILR